MLSFGTILKALKVQMMKTEFDVANGAETICAKANSVENRWHSERLPNKIKDLKFSGDVEINYSKTDGKILRFENCIFNNIIIKNETYNQLEELKFVNCQINSVEFFRCCMNVIFEMSNVQSIKCDECNLPKIKIENSDVHTLSFESKGKADEIFITSKCNIEKIESKDVQIGKLRLHSSHIEHIYTDSSIDQLELNEGAELDYFLIENKDEFKKFLNTLKNKRKKLSGGTISQKNVELRHQNKMILALYNQFLDENRFKEMDVCLVILRSINCRLNRLQTKKLLRKFGYLVEYFVLGKMFGWGVQVLNSLITSSVVIALFSLIHFVKLRNSTSSVWQCMFLSAETSVNRFFNVNEIDPMPILGQFDTAEQIIGVIILTIFTGVIARKIIR